MRRNLFNILILFIFTQASPVLGQNKYCLYEDYAIKAYQDKDYLIAKGYIDTAITLCPDLLVNAYAWHIKGFIYQSLYYETDNKNSNSIYRDPAVEAFKRSLELDTLSREFESMNKKAIGKLAKSYYNDAAVRIDTNNYLKAIEYYDLYKSTYVFGYPDYDFNQRDVVFYNVMGVVYEQKYYNNTKAFESFIFKSVESYEKTLVIDSLNYDANQAIGFIYHNLGVEMILNDLDDEGDLEMMMLYQEKSVEYFTKALPYLKKAYVLKPNSEDVVRGMAAVYLSLHEYERYELYMDVLEDLQNTEEQEAPIPDND